MARMGASCASRTMWTGGAAHPVAALSAVVTAVLGTSANATLLTLAILLCSKGDYALPLPYPLPDGYELDVNPNGTKVVRGRRCSQAITFTFMASEPLQYQYPFLLGQYLSLCSVVQHMLPDHQVGHNCLRPLLPCEICGLWLHTSTQSGLQVAVRKYIFRPLSHSQSSDFLEEPLTSGGEGCDPCLASYPASSPLN